MPQRNKPSALHADDFDLLSTGDQIILQARGDQTEFFARDADGNELSITNVVGDLGVDLEEDGALLVADATALDFTGSGVDVVDDGDGTATLTITDTVRPWTAVTQAAAYTAASYENVLADASGGAFPVTLPAPSTDVMASVKKIDGTVNPVTIATPGAETIDGQASIDLTDQYTSRTIASDGADYFIV